ncbi:MAG: hypothetical protein FJ087_13060 [Deltaproteobacteria bacterium]|nr:hypothetical protein [Deltaproteobacteria bacterium]
MRTSCTIPAIPAIPAIAAVAAMAALATGVPAARADGIDAGLVATSAARDGPAPDLVVPAAPARKDPIRSLPKVLRADVKVGAHSLFVRYRPVALPGIDLAAGIDLRLPVLASSRAPSIRAGVRWRYDHPLKPQVPGADHAHAWLLEFSADF